MEELELRTLNEKDEKAHFNFIKEMTEIDGSVSPMAADIREADLSFKGWLNRTRKQSAGEDLFKGWVPSTVMFLFRKGNKKILGSIDIRHKTNNKILRYYGHIGYGVAPSERRKGYASAMLAKALDYCKNNLGLRKVLITCSKDNIGSAKTIQKNGGVLENEVFDEEGKVKQRYWISLS